MAGAGRGGISFGDVANTPLVSREVVLGTAVELLARDVLPVKVRPIVPLLE